MPATLESGFWSGERQADVFWATEAIDMDDLTSWLDVYQLSRDMIPRGIVEVTFDDRNP